MLGLVFWTDLSIMVRCLTILILAGFCCREYFENIITIVKQHLLIAIYAGYVGCYFINHQDPYLFMGICFNSVFSGYRLCMCWVFHYLL